MLTYAVQLPPQFYNSIVVNNTKVAPLFNASVLASLREVVTLALYVHVMFASLADVIVAAGASSSYGTALLIPPCVWLGYMTGDLLSGAYHYFMDTYDVPLLHRAHANFRLHHDNPLSMEVFHWMETVTEVMPAGILVGAAASKWITAPWLQAFCVALNLVACMAQVTHRIAHRRTHEYDEHGLKKFHIPAFIKYLQDKRVILNNLDHRVHHVTEVTNYCIANNHASKLLDGIIWVFNLPVSTFKNSGRVHVQHPVSKRSCIMHAALRPTRLPLLKAIQ